MSELDIGHDEECTIHGVYVRLKRIEEKLDAILTAMAAADPYPITSR